MRNKIPAEILGLDQGILNNVIELNDINKTYNLYKLIMKKQFFSFTYEWQIQTCSSGQICKVVEVSKKQFFRFNIVE